MAYSDFKLKELIKQFSLILKDKNDLFAEVSQSSNEQEGNQVTNIYGAVTSGTAWRFVKLKGKTVSVDVVEYYISNVEKIIGIFMAILAENRISSN